MSENHRKKCKMFGCDKFRSIFFTTFWGFGFTPSYKVPIEKESLTSSEKSPDCTAASSGHTFECQWESLRLFSKWEDRTAAT